MRGGRDRMNWKWRSSFQLGEGLVAEHRGGMVLPEDAPSALAVARLEQPHPEAGAIGRGARRGYATVVRRPVDGRHIAGIVQGNPPSRLRFPTNCGTQSALHFPPPVTGAKAL